MDMGNVIKAIVAAVMMITIVTVVVVPILGDATYDQLGNNTPNNYFKAVEDGTITSASGTYTINGETVEISGNLLIISTTLAVQHTNSSTMTLYDYGGNHFGKISSMTISGNSYSTTGATEITNGSLGDDCVIFVGKNGTGATWGQFYSNSFYVDQGDDVMNWRIETVQGPNSTSTNIRALTHGTVDDLTAQAVSVTGDVFTPASSVTATVNPNSYSEPNEKVFYVAGKPMISYTATIDGTEYAGTSSGSGALFVAPLEYTQVTDEGNAIESLVNIAPLLMVIGVILMIIFAIVARSS